MLKTEVVKGRERLQERTLVAAIPCNFPLPSLYMNSLSDQAAFGNWKGDHDAS